MTSSGMLWRVAFVRTDVSEELSTSFIRVTRIGELGTKNFFAACVGCWLLLENFLVHRFLSPWWRRRYVPPKLRLLQRPHSVTSQKTPFFRVALLLISFLSCFLLGLFFRFWRRRQNIPPKHHFTFFWRRDVTCLKDASPQMLKISVVFGIFSAEDVSRKGVS
jgi:hypothetical protein